MDLLGILSGLYGGTVVAMLLLLASEGLPARGGRGAGYSFTADEGDVAEKNCLSGRGESLSPPGLVSVSLSGWTCVEMLRGSFARCNEFLFALVGDPKCVFSGSSGS